MSHENTKEEMDTVVRELKVIVDRLQAMSPLYADFIKNNPDGKFDWRTYHV